MALLGLTGYYFDFASVLFYNLRRDYKIRWWLEVPDLFLFFSLLLLSFPFNGQLATTQPARWRCSTPTLTPLLSRSKDSQTNASRDEACSLCRRLGGSNLNASGDKADGDTANFNFLLIYFFFCRNQFVFQK